MNARKIIEFIRFILIAALIVIPFRLFVAQPFLVSGNSMFPTFKNSDYLIVDELSYRFREPKRGEVIVFRSPLEPAKHLIKRITGLPGETVRFSLPLAADTAGTLPHEVTLKEKEYFVEGDNRNESFDSRYWGVLARDKITGRVFLRLWPPFGIGLFPGAQKIAPLSYIPEKL